MAASILLWWTQPFVADLAGTGGFRQTLVFFDELAQRFVLIAGDVVDACSERGDYLHPKSHAIRANLQGLDDSQTVDCTWLTAPQGKGGRGKAVTLPCDMPVQLELPYPGGAWVQVEIGGRKVAEVSAKVTDLFVVGMGDSFASGEGNPDVPVRFSPERTGEGAAKGERGGEC